MSHIDYYNSELLEKDELETLRAFVTTVATETLELSHDKAFAQRNSWASIANKLLISLYS